MIFPVTAKSGTRGSEARLLEDGLHLANVTIPARKTEVRKSGLAAGFLNGKSVKRGSSMASVVSIPSTL
jgi:hypothetical protein